MENLKRTLVLGLVLAVAISMSAGVFAADRIDINTADQATLENLDGIGPAKAKAIIQYRKANGPFKSAADLKKVSGIGEMTFKANKDRITVGTAKPAPTKKKTETKAQPGKKSDTKAGESKTSKTN